MLPPRLAFVALALALAQPAVADELSACFRAHEDAQRLRNGGKLSAARSELGVCTRAACPDLVRNDCARWLDELSAAQPTLVIVARGAPAGELRVFIDGAQVPATGRAVPVDPGERHVRVVARDGRAAETKVWIAEGDKGRRVSVRLSAPRTPVVEPRGVHPSVFALAALAGAGVTAFAILAGVGYAKEKDLARSCRPTCAPDRVDEVRRLYIAADVVGAVGVASGLVALTIGVVGATGEAKLSIGPRAAALEARW